MYKSKRINKIRNRFFSRYYHVITKVGEDYFVVKTKFKIIGENG